MKKLLIVHKKQFGYHTDSYQIARHLENSFDIHFICLDSSLPKFPSNNIKVTYVSSSGSFLTRGSRFIRIALNKTRSEVDYRLLYYFTFCSLIKILSRKQLILDFRTGGVHPLFIRRWLDNLFKSFESLFFSKITIISEGLRKKLYIPKQKAKILPLGSNKLSVVDKSFDHPRLLYIGTLYNRRIIDTIKGIRILLDKHPEYKTKLTYDIVGNGYKNEEEELLSFISKNNLDKNIQLHGRKAHGEIQDLLDNCNIGLSYIPITSYFDYQPPTKTFEYILSGMVCLATRTKENKKYVSHENGVSHMDNPESFASALELVVDNFHQYNSTVIRQSLEQYTWANISKSLKEYLMYE